MKTVLLNTIFLIFDNSERISSDAIKAKAILDIINNLCLLFGFNFDSANDYFNGDLSFITAQPLDIYVIYIFDVDVESQDFARVLVHSVGKDGVGIDILNSIINNKIIKNTVKKLINHLIAY